MTRMFFLRMFLPLLVNAAPGLTPPSCGRWPAAGSRECSPEKIEAEERRQEPLLIEVQWRHSRRSDFVVASVVAGWGMRSTPDISQRTHLACSIHGFQLRRGTSVRTPYRGGRDARSPVVWYALAVAGHC